MDDYTKNLNKQLELARRTEPKESDRREASLQEDRRIYTAELRMR